MKKMTALILTFILAMTFTGYVSGESSGTNTTTSTITMSGDSITFAGSGATIDGTTVTITSAGTYTVTGTLNDGQIRVDTEDAETVKLVLNGATIACSTSAPLYVVNAEKTVITLADGTKNSLTDGTSYILEDTGSDEPNAAVFSNDDLTINGEGSLTVTARYNNGIVSSDDLKINGGRITVTALHDGIKGKDSVTVKEGTIVVKAGGDGIQSNNDEDAEKGYVSIEGGTITITAGQDGIQAESDLSVSGGAITISSGSGSSSTSYTPGTNGYPSGDWDAGTADTSSATSDSAKGLKAGVAVTISGGTITIDSSDDSIHSNDSILINGGTIEISSGDDGMHSDSSLEVNSGDIRIAKSYEGMESASITLNGGDVHIVSSDDGINTVSEDAGSSQGLGQVETGGNPLTINGGYFVIDAGGDGLDIDGPITMTAGTVIINGPTNNGNGPVDYTGNFKVTGGDFLAVGSSGMAQAPGTSSTQYSVMLTFSSAIQAGTILHIESEVGKDVLTFVPTKAYQSVVFSSPDLDNGETYTVYTGGSSTGTVSDGLYSGGKYTAGTEVTTFTLSGIVTKVGSSNNQNPWTNPGNNTRPDPGTNPGNNTGPNPWTNPGNTTRPDPGTNTGNNTRPTAIPTQVPVVTGSISVSSLPSRAMVSLDGTYKGLTPLTLTGVAAGSHQITLTKAGYQDYTTSVTVARGSNSSVSASLLQTSGSSRVVPTRVIPTRTVPTIDRTQTPYRITTEVVSATYKTSSYFSSLKSDLPNTTRYSRVASASSVVTDESRDLVSSSYYEEG